LFYDLKIPIFKIPFKNTSVKNQSFLGFHPSVLSGLLETRQLPFLFPSLYRSLFPSSSLPSIAPSSHSPFFVYFSASSAVCCAVFLLCVFCHEY